MVNRVIIKQDRSVIGTFKASVFNKNGLPVLGSWQEFDVGGRMIWEPGKYGFPVEPFYIARGISPDHEHNFVAFAVYVNFNRSIFNASITLGIDQCASNDGCPPCLFFKAETRGVEHRIVRDGIPVSGTSLPPSCDCEYSRVCRRSGRSGFYADFSDNFLSVVRKNGSPMRLP